jgi:hypothetical protein
MARGFYFLRHLTIEGWQVTFHPILLKLYITIMKKILLAALSAIILQSAFAQTEPAVAASKKKDWSKVSIGNRANDHFMIQLGYDGWAQKPDTIRTKGFGRHLNVYFMLDLPFKTDPRFSVGIGAGIGSSSIYFDKQEPQIAGTTQALSFKDVSNTSHFKKFKLVNAWAEAPVELRFSSNPLTPNKTFKLALGAKIGTMLNAHTRGKTLESASGGIINNYVAKASTKKYFNTTRLAATARIGYGVFGIYGAYQVSRLIKDGSGPDVRPYSIGFTISGL